MQYLKRNGKWILATVFLSICYHLYFFYLLPDPDYRYLWYLDLLAAVCLLTFILVDYFMDYRKEKRKKELLSMNTLILPLLPDWENKDLLEHDSRILEERTAIQFRMNCDLQDYVTKAVHEIKVPLSACLLMAEDFPGAVDREEMLWQLNRINVQLRLALLGVKVQSSLFDVQIRPVRLSDMVKTALHNNQFFLIKMHFEIKLSVKEEIVHTDDSYLVYVLDQLLSNAVKYAGENPCLHISSESIKSGQVKLMIEDHGEGIIKEDLGRIFEKGYTGNNHRNGEYKSTGMGLYMAEQICHKLGCQISVESIYGSYTRFIISFPAENFLG